MSKGNTLERPALMQDERIDPLERRRCARECKAHLRELLELK